MYTFRNMSPYYQTPFYPPTQHPHSLQQPIQAGQQMMQPVQPNQFQQGWSSGQAPVNPFEIYAKPAFPPIENAYNETGNQFYDQNSRPPGMMGYFQDQNGQLDMEKMMKTMGQLAQTANQFSPLVKGIGGFIKGFR
ncbi:YppG family protein [Thalassobacillus pellis]|uniref:YppG family protein n=1 Tax=Thalassobacillus pellis TaxID=748008 RepID=UPI0019619DD8|nr:YppG family protein [Thalassobacillus pellis]MBM7554382.1 hypothetical protein [Thalassobacillus pellis]